MLQMILVSESCSEKMCLQSPMKTGRLFAARTSAGSLFHMFSTATLYGVLVNGAWSRGCFEEHSDIEKPLNWWGISNMSMHHYACVALKHSLHS